MLLCDQNAPSNKPETVYHYFVSYMCI